MVATVGMESNLSDLVEYLLLLKHDAIAAYDRTTDRLERAEYEQKIAEFKNDHTLHVQQRTKPASAVGATAHHESDVKQMVTTGKVTLASLIGDD